jgi:acyl carrier protein
MDNLLEFTQKFQDQYIDSDTFKMQPETEFRQVGSWDSLTGMAVLVMIKDDYGVDISAETLKTLKYVKEVYELVKASKI